MSRKEDQVDQKLVLRYTQTNLENVIITTVQPDVPKSIKTGMVIALMQATDICNANAFMIALPNSFFFIYIET